mgnify:FL=1
MSNYDSNKYEKKYEKDVHIDNEVKKLFKKNNGIITTADFMKLRHKYDDAELVENIQRLYLEKYNLISKKAKKFAKLVREKYGDQQYPFHQLLSKTKLFILIVLDLSIY